jgi:hypothetical protein
VKKIAIVGTISNAERKLESNLRRLTQAFSNFEIAYIFLVESDSTDDTVSLLQKISSNTSNFNYVSLGTLRNQLPERISRIRFCRNKYVEELRRIAPSLGLDYVAVADLDGMNSRISKIGVESSFVRSDWSAVLANQLGGYYDLLALRHKEWCPMDVMHELKSEQSKIDKSALPLYSIIKRLERRFEFDTARRRILYSRMVRIPRTFDWIQVDSGFGGLGIYRTEVFLKFDYSLQKGDLSNESEHIALSKRITQSGGTIFVNPRMINNFLNTYNINRFFVIRQIRELYWNTRKKIFN